LRTVHRVKTPTAGLRRRVWTTAAVTLCVCTTLLTISLSSESHVVPPWNFGIGAALNLAAAVALVWRHDRPWLVLGLAVLGPLVFSTDATAALVALVALCRVARYRQLVPAALAVVVACGISLTYDAHRRREYSVLTIGTKPATDGASVTQYTVAGWIPWVVALALVAATVGLGYLLRTRTALDQAVRTRDRATAQHEVLRDEVVRAEERTRIARDMHDTLAASLSRISLFAGGLQVNGADNPEKVANSAALIRSTAHDALDELKEIIGVLRGGSSGSTGSQHQGPQHQGPQHQGIEAVATLVQSARAAGIHAVLLSDLAPGTLGQLAGHTAYRVVQESLTNVQKHAHDQTVHISIVGKEDSGVRVCVRNRLSAAGHQVPIGSRTGLRGLAEQAHQIGGTLQAGVRDKEFRVDCWLPWST